jgi:hypothetical protein
MESLALLVLDALPLVSPWKPMLLWTRRTCSGTAVAFYPIYSLVVAALTLDVNGLDMYLPRGLTFLATRFCTALLLSWSHHLPEAC